jgi:hypothetical protein
MHNHTHTDSQTAWKSWSSVGLIIVGFHWAYTLDPISGLAIAFMGMGSFYGHATRDYLTDWYGMYLAFATIIGYYGSELGWLCVYGVRYFEIFMLLIGIHLCIFHNTIVRRVNIPWLPMRLHYILIGALYLTGAVISFWVLDPITATISVSLFAVGFWLRQKVDHGLWHIIIAIALAFITLNILSL